ncbi:MAG: ABC transporter substrate binding protein, partial [Betaproteobacteria bacterium]
DRLHDQVLMMSATPFTNMHRAAIMNLVARRLPFITDGTEWAKAGAVITYAPNTLTLYRRSASYVDKILRGANAGDLPIEQVSKFELIVNLKAAAALGITVPQSILLRADEIIQ